MSTITRSFLLKEMRDQEVVLDTIQKMGLNFNKQGNIISVSNGVELNITETGILAKFEEPHAGPNLEKNQFIENLQNEYGILLHEKIEKMRRETASSIEQKMLEKISAEEHRKFALKQKRELARLESLQRKEQKELSEKIEEKVRILSERGQSLGYNIKVETQGSKKVILFTKA